MNKLKLSVQDVHGIDHDLIYILDTNDIASVWYKKVRHLNRVPLSEHYTFKCRLAPLEKINQSIREDLDKLNVLINLNYPIKASYCQEDCNILHAVTVSTQYNYSPEIREIFHSMHRDIHSLEYHIQKTKFNKIYAGWGEKEGPLTTKFESLPYDLYQRSIPGTINLIWAEFGKTPWQYWKDRDLDNIDHFLKTCRPHRTFRAQFSLCLWESSDSFDEEFEKWFDSYRDFWQQRYGCGWIPLYQWGGIPLAYPETHFDWKSVETIKSIQTLMG